MFDKVKAYKNIVPIFGATLYKMRHNHPAFTLFYW